MAECIGMLIITFPSYSIKGLGYTAIEAQLFSVPPYAVAAFLTGMFAVLG